MDFSQILTGLNWSDAVSAILVGGVLVAAILWTLVVVRQVANFFGFEKRGDRTIDGWYSGGYTNYQHNDDYKSISKSVDRHMRKRT